MTSSNEPVDIASEGDFAAEEVFTESWLAYALPILSHTLGVEGPDGGVHVVLSPTEKHKARFPVRIEEALTLVGPLDDPLDDAEQQALVTESRRYAHGVATRARPALQLPAGITDGDAVICLDIPTLREIADEIGVSALAVLARVLVHELSHVLRRHIERGTATHGNLGEGDAQTDAWKLLTGALCDPTWGGLAQAARVAQVRQARRQPPAYNRFGQGSPDTSRWDENPPEPRTRFVRPPVTVAALSQSELIEVPVRYTDRSGKPRVNDRIVLADRSLAVGPWVVVATDTVSHLEHAKNLQAVQNEVTSRDRYTAEPKWLWLQLQRTANARVVLELASALHSGTAPHELIHGRESEEVWGAADQMDFASGISAYVEKVEAEAIAREPHDKEFFEGMGKEYVPTPTDPFAD